MCVIDDKLFVWALPVFVLSLPGTLVQDFGRFVLADDASLAGAVGVVLQAVVPSRGAGLVLLGRKGISHGWLL